MLRARTCLRHAADGRRRHRDRPADHDSDGLALHSRRDPVPVAAARRGHRPDWPPAGTRQTVTRFELFIAGRYLRARRKEAVISVITLISVLGVAAGVAALVVALAVTNGFRNTLQRNLLGAMAHINVVPRTPGDGIENWQDMVARIRQVPHVIAVSPALYSPTFLTGPLQSKGAFIKGVDVASEIGRASCRERV